MKRYFWGAALSASLFACSVSAQAADKNMGAERVADEAAIAASPAPAAGIVEVWSARDGATLSDTLASWAERAGWKLIWESDSDFHLAAAGDFEGDFQSAATSLIRAFGQTRPRLRATFYEGNSVLRVWAERKEP